MEKKLHIVASCISSAILSIIFVTSLTIAGELSAPLKDWLAHTFSHHWLGKSVLTATVFVCITLGLILIPRTPTTGFVLGRKLQRLNVITALATLSLVGFFTYHYFFA